MAMKSQDLSALLDKQPRVRLAQLPTPLEPLQRLAQALGGPELWVKRDDLTGLAFGGNKMRQMEYVFAEARAKGADSIVIGAYTQSNWCRQATASACKLGMEVALVLLHGEKGPVLQGNLLLDKLMGADVTVVDIDSMEKLQPLLDAKADELRRRGKKPFMVEPLGIDSLSLGAIGYVRAALELDAQLSERQLDPDYLYLCGANMTPAGLALGLKALGRRVRIQNFAPIRWTLPRDEDIVRIANATAERIGLDTRLDLADFDSTDEYIGERYGLVTDAGLEALKLAASHEGLILDPVYSSKAMAGLIDHIRKGRFDTADKVVFLHTGGTPALFAYAEDLGLE